jgi:hypothetical protein
MCLVVDVYLPMFLLVLLLPNLVLKWSEIDITLVVVEKKRLFVVTVVVLTILAQMEFVTSQPSFVRTSLTLNVIKSLVSTNNVLIILLFVVNLMFVLKELVIMLRVHVITLSRNVMII